MYLDHFGLSEAPFRITPHTDFFFSGANRGATLEALLYAITHDEGIVKVTGEVGAGKTMLCRVLIERLPAGVETVYLSNPSLAREEILQAILDDLRFPTGNEQRPNQLLRTLQEHLIQVYGDGRRVVLLIYEAHAMPAETLEQIRLLSNLESNRHKLLQIALFGQQELDEQLGTALLRPLRERITHSFRLEPLVHADVGQYLMFRMRQASYKGPDLFDASALKLIAKSSQGLTRRLNILADKCLLAAYAEAEHGITRKHALAAIRDAGFAPLGTAADRRALPQQWKWFAAAGAVALAGAGVFAGMHLSSQTSPAPSAPVRTAAPAPAPSSVPSSVPASALAAAPAPAAQETSSPQQPAGTATAGTSTAALPVVAPAAPAVTSAVTSNTAEQTAAASNSAQTGVPGAAASTGATAAVVTAPQVAPAAPAAVAVAEPPRPPVERAIPDPQASYTATAVPLPPARRATPAKPLTAPRVVRATVDRTFTPSASGAETQTETRAPSRED